MISQLLLDIRQSLTADSVGIKLNTKTWNDICAYHKAQRLKRYDLNPFGVAKSDKVDKWNESLNEMRQQTAQECDALRDSSEPVLYGMAVTKDDNLADKQFIVVNKKVSRKKLVPEVEKTILWSNEKLSEI